MSIRDGGRSDSAGRSEPASASKGKGAARKTGAKQRPANADELSPETLLPDVVETDLEETQLDDEGRHDRIAQRALEIARERGFEPGHELDDWLQAEREIVAIEGPQVRPENQFTG